jgi:D-alanyl-D-alanine carboxypeptidase/D-alanyl-D-alanine-endopeptidase (penicillin-binding protein 4)
MRTTFPRKSILVACLFAGCFSFALAQAQDIGHKASRALSRFTGDPQLAYAAVSFSLLDGRSGQVIYSLNGHMGLAPASCRKIITAASAFSILGADYRFQTGLGYSGQLKDGLLTGDLVISGTGDPTLGSWRYPETSVDTILQHWVDAVRRAGIRQIQGKIVGDASAFESQMPPDGWIWQDMGNYYGAGASGLSWHENQYDLHLQPASHMGGPVRIVGTDPPVSLQFINELKTGSAGSGDQTYIYAAPYSTLAYLRGTAPAGARNFTVSGALTRPALLCARQLEEALKGAQIGISQKATSLREMQIQGQSLPGPLIPISTHWSPSLDSIIYWFLHRSINLYGEQLIRTFARETGQPGSNEAGLSVEKKWWVDRGIPQGALQLADGSGLSPGTRVTTHALARILYLAEKQPWYARYRECFPIIHGIRMKSGHINGVCAYSGFLTGSGGVPLIFSFIVNNYTGSSSGVNSKMFAVLDALAK